MLFRPGVLSTFTTQELTRAYESASKMTRSGYFRRGLYAQGKNRVLKARNEKKTLNTTYFTSSTVGHKAAHKGGQGGMHPLQDLAK